MSLETLLIIILVIVVIGIAAVVWRQRQPAAPESTAEKTIESRTSRQPPPGREPERSSAIDLISLEPTAYRVMQVLLRQVETTYPQLCTAIDGLPENERLSREELNRVLRKLKDENWLVVSDNDGTICYKPTLKRKTTNVLDTYAPKRKTGSLLSQSVWDSIDAKPDRGKSPFQSDDKQESQ